MNLQNKGKHIGLGVVILLFLCLPLITTQPRYLHMFIMGLIFSMLTMGFVLILRVGQFSLGQAAYLAIGGYASALLTMRAGLPLPLAMLLSGVIAGAIAAVLGVIVLRIRGLYFSIITFAFAEVVRLIIINWKSLLGGHDGIWDVPGLFETTSRVPQYYFILFLVIVTAVVLWRLDKSRIGKIFKHVAENELMAESIGINTLKYKVLAYVVACFFAGVAGSFYAHYYMLVHPESFNVWVSIMVQIQAMVGGTASIIAGPLIGAIVLTALTEFLRATAGLQPLIYGAVIMIIIFFLPGGLESLGPMFFRKWLRRPRDKA